VVRGLTNNPFTGKSANQMHYRFVSAAFPNMLRELSVWEPGQQHDTDSLDPNDPGVFRAWNKLPT